MKRRTFLFGCAATLLAPLIRVSPSRADLAAALEKQLEAGEFIYIASTRKDGNLSKPAEIWFMYHDGAVYVGTRPTSWRVKRINWGRPQAKIWIGKPDGPSFRARGELVGDPALQQVLLDTYARKYSAGWGKWEKSFREGFKDGSRVLVKYSPLPSQPEATRPVASAR